MGLPYMWNRVRLTCSSFRQERQNQASHNPNISQIKNRPPAKIEKIEDVLAPNEVDQVAGGATKRESQPEKCSRTLKPATGSVKNDCTHERNQPQKR